MSLLLSAALAAAPAPGQPPEDAPPPLGILPPRVSIESAEIPAMSFDCALRLDDGRDARVVLRRGGARTQRISGALVGVPLAVAVEQDPAAVFANYRLDAWGTESLFGQAARPGGGFGERFQIAIARAGDGGATEEGGRYAVTLNEHRAPDWGMRPIVRALGFCDGTSVDAAAVPARQEIEE